MGLLSRKPEFGIARFCQRFYDSRVFWGDWSSEFLKIVFEFELRADHPPTKNDTTLFEREMTAIHLELFALAWMHRFKKDRLTIPQSIFTRRYLEENGKPDIWGIMGEYNQAIARSAITTLSGEPRDKKHVNRICELRADMLSHWVEDNIGDPRFWSKEDEDRFMCVCRVADRIGVDDSQAHYIALELLVARLADKLGCNINPGTGAYGELWGKVSEFYNDAREYLKSIKLRS